MADVYGVMSYTVSQRQHEIGIRMALGARSGEIVGKLFEEGIRYVVLGVVIGLIVSLAVTRFLSSLLFGVKQTDPATYIVMSVFLLICATAAIFVPSRRIVRVDPVVALRCE